MRIDPRAILKLPLPSILLGLVAAAVLAANISLIAGGTQASGLLATPAKPAAPLTVDLSHAPKSPDLAAIQTQPLMYATRTFYVAPRADAVPAAPPLPDYRFAGALVVPNKPAVALLGRQGGATRRVHVGDDVDGWKVHAVEGRRVVLQWQDQQREIAVQAAPASVGLRRVPMQRQRVASSGIQTLGAPGKTGTNVTSPSPGVVFGGPAVNMPRLYSPPPN